MAVKTEVSLEQWQDHISLLYNLPMIIRAEGISEGIENTNYLLVDIDGNKYIATIFEGRTNLESLDFFISWQNYLSEKLNSCAPVVYRMKDNKTSVSNLYGKPCAIFTFLTGKSIDIHCSSSCSSFASEQKQDIMRQVGAWLAKSHLISRQYLHQEARQKVVIPETQLNLRQWRQTADKYGLFAQEAFARAIAVIEHIDATNLDRLIIHADLFHDNVFFIYKDGKSQLSAVIDFYFSCFDYAVYDIAVTAVAWCFNHDNIWQQQLYTSLLAGYQHFKPLTVAEVEAMPAMLIRACMRFYCSRVEDYYNPNNKTHKKSPKQFWQRLEFFMRKSSV
jgi:homoserine kinase type II